MSIDKHLAEFLEALNGGKGDLDAWLECNSEQECRVAIRAALTEQAETHAIELRAYEATVQNLEQRIRELGVELSPTITCDDCGSETPDPWHSSKNNNRHHHRCDACHTAALEAQRVPEGWQFVKHSDDTITVTKRDARGVIVGCSVSESATNARQIPEEALWLLASDMLAAAPKKEPRHD